MYSNYLPIVISNQKSLFLFGICGISLVLGHFANGQTTTGQQVQQVQEQVQQNAQQIDTTTLVAGGTAAGTIATFLANYLKN